jgi:predicted alpha/beta hydrolase
MGRKTYCNASPNSFLSQVLVAPIESASAIGALGSVASSDFVLAATDGYPLAARLWARSQPPHPTTVALINGGAGIESGYYDRFARYLSQHGVPTLVYDYRGIAKSKPPSLRGFVASVEDWGSKDCAAVLEWMAARFPEAQRTVIGHSVGGFVTGFVTNGLLIDRMLLVGAHTGYWRDYAPSSRLAMYLLWHKVMPALTRVVGYFPGRRLHLLEDLPAGIALEWANRREANFWWNLRTKDGEPDQARIENAIARFMAIRAPTLALTAADDAFATEAATGRILALYRNCPATRRVVRPNDVGGQKIGHFGFFRSRFSDTLWPQAVDWLRADDSA